MKNIIKFVIKEKDKGQRVDSIIKSYVKTKSRNQIKNLILNNCLKVNEQVEKSPSKKLNLSDKIIFEIPEEPQMELKPYKYKLNIVFEDNDLLIIDKAAGISMHPGAGNYEKTLVNALINYNKINLSNLGGDFRPGIVHRIDKDTSGLIVIAKNNEVHANLSEQFKNHTITRVYNTLVWGKLRPRSGKIESLITRSSKNRQLMEIGRKKGKKAITNYRTIKIFENNFIPTFSFIECILETGRTHQIRVHLSSKGNYILGDKQYKKKYKKIKNVDKDLLYYINNLERQFLHAGILGFDHPITKKRVKFYSELPKELSDILNKLHNT